MQSRFSRVRARISGRYALATALILVLGIPSAAIGFGEGRSILGGKRNPSSDATKAFSAETEIIANNSTYGTRQSNKRDGDGGGAIYGCRSNAGNEACVKASNLKGGRAFEFETVGKEGGRIQTGDATGAPFTTNATGVATGLNADKVDGKDATDFAGSGDLAFATRGRRRDARREQAWRDRVLGRRGLHVHGHVRPRREQVLATLRRPSARPLRRRRASSRGTTRRSA